MGGMALQLGTGLHRRASGSSAFTPASLFGAGDSGGYGDINPTTTGVSVGSAIAQANDESGNGNHLLQGTEASKPILRQTAGGVYYAEADGDDDFLRFQLGEEWTEPVTYGVAFKLDDATGSRDLIDVATSSVSTRHQFGIRSGNFEMYAGTLSTIAAADTSTHRAILKFDNTSSTALLDGVETSEAPDGSTPPSGDFFALFSNSIGNAAFVEGRIARWFVIVRALTSEEESNLDDWLNVW